MDRPWSAAVAALSALLAAACASSPSVRPDAPAAPAEEEWDRELPEGVFLEDATPEGAVARIPLRVVDDATGEPIAGARITNSWEADTPHAEPWESLVEWTAETDRDGFALVPATERGPWSYVEASGYAPIGDMHRQHEHRLVRGRDFPMEVRDWRGRPVPGAIVDLFLGCGHTPNARCETAGPDGRLVFRCIDFRHSDFWIRAPGVAGRSSAYGQGWDGLPVEDGFHVLVAAPGPVQEGRVLRPDGTPAAGAIVGTRGAHRGPWAVAGADGRFRVLGSQSGDGLTAIAPPADPVPEGFQPAQVEFATAPGVFATVRLPAAGERRLTPEERDAERDRARAESELYGRGEEPEPEVPAEGPGIRVRVAAAPGVVARGRVRIRAVRDGDGAVESTSPLFRAGAAIRALALGRGEWTVTAGDPMGMLRPESRRVVVGDGWSDASFVLVANPRWNPRVVARGPDGAEVELLHPRGGEFEIVSDDGVVDPVPVTNENGEPDGSIFVPASGPFAVRFRAEDGREARVLLDGPPADAGPVLVLPPPTPRDSWFPEDDRPRGLPAARLTVLLPDGTPAANADVDALAAWNDRALTGAIVRGDARSRQLDETGSVEAAFDRGERLTIRATGEGADTLLPFRATIDGPGPWTLRWPDGEVRVRIVDGAGAPIPWSTVALSGEDELTAEDGVLVLRGASAGPLRLWVGEEERRTRDLRLLLRPGEKREVVVRLNPAGPLAPK
jgi:hypothetical protein